jgi:hypothetical protein
VFGPGEESTGPQEVGQKTRDNNYGLAGGSSRLSEENRTLRQEFAAAREAQTKSDRRRKQEIAGLCVQQEDVRTELARLSEEFAKTWQEQARAGEEQTLSARYCRIEGREYGGNEGNC